MWQAVNPQEKHTVLVVRSDCAQAGVLIHQSCRLWLQLRPLFIAVGVAGCTVLTTRCSSCSAGTTESRISFVMSSNASYGERSYWNTRYGGPQLETYEWYMPWSQLKDYILKPVYATHTTAPFVPSTPAPVKAPPATADTLSTIEAATEGESKAASAASTTAAESSSSSAVAATPSSSACSGCKSLRYLIVGCGNSELSAHMWQDGFRHMVSVDYSDIVIQKMKLLYESENLKELADTFKVADCRDMSDTPDGAYDVIIDKGTLDALLCGSESNKHQAALLLEIHRVLKRGGVFILITYGQTTSRLAYLERPKFSWDVSHVTLGPTRFLYACVKRGGSVKSHD